ncbi:uncharacterized protein YpiB (UPF0302 family) [Hydrogenispora ethanolica]|jgi:uncharacterized protein YpiB (UPF0302 family)|uniref:Uncharacterized protein YpiB (UPF0302 family) n=1 Tax=Hydrogenispora ethanolica TaxID=1082276 RepID=A0A4R1R8Z8_HYDET|nr:YpiB family protein [Hydrogenispora ethanolica]TCL62030.1 uncharacterized protein YpiB (UPF0302 family) [Hydrogenispora ethanolica]
MAKKTISDWAKKNFLHWFIETYPFPSPDAKEFLLQLAAAEALLPRLHIVMDGSCLRPLLVVSTDGSGMPPLLLISATDQSSSEYQAILEQLAATDPSAIYLTLYFPDRSTSETFQAVVEECPTACDSAYADQIMFQFELSLLNAGIRREIAKQNLLQKIDEALDEKDKDKFLHWVQKLKSL